MSHITWYLKVGKINPFSALKLRKKLRVECFANSNTFFADFARIADFETVFADSESSLSDFESGFSGSESNLDWNIIIER